MYPFSFKNNEVAALGMHLIQTQCPLPFSMIMANLCQYDMLTTESDATTRTRILEIEDKQLEEMRETFEIFAKGKRLLEEHGVDVPDEALATKVFEAAQRKVGIVEAEQATRKLAAEALTATVEKKAPAGLKFKHKGELKVLITEGEDKDWIYCLETDGTTWVKERKATAEELKILERKRKKEE